MLPLPHSSPAYGTTHWLGLFAHFRFWFLLQCLLGEGLNPLTLQSLFIYQMLPPPPYTLSLLRSWLHRGTLAALGAPCVVQHPLLPVCQSQGRVGAPCPVALEGQRCPDLLEQLLSSTPSPMSYCILLPHPAPGCYQVHKPGARGFLGEPGLPCPLLRCVRPLSDRVPWGCFGGPRDLPRQARIPALGSTSL